MKKRTKNYCINLMFFLFNIYIGFAQKEFEKPVKWTTTIEKTTETDYNLIFTATIKNTWHLYSQNVPENGPLPTVFNLNPNSSYSCVGEVKEEKGKTVYEDVFEMKIKYFETKAIFKQSIKVDSKNEFKISGTINFMLCNSEECMPESTKFEIKIE